MSLIYFRVYCFLCFSIYFIFNNNFALILFDNSTSQAHLQLIQSNLRHYLVFLSVLRVLLIETLDFINGFLNNLAYLLVFNLINDLLGHLRRYSILKTRVWNEFRNSILSIFIHENIVNLRINWNLGALIHNILQIDPLILI